MVRLRFTTGMGIPNAHSCQGENESARGFAFRRGQALGSCVRSTHVTMVWSGRLGRSQPSIWSARRSYVVPRPMITSGRRHGNWPRCRSNGRTFGEPAIYPMDIFSGGLIVLNEISLMDRRPPYAGKAESAVSSLTQVSARVQRASRSCPCRRVKLRCTVSLGSSPKAA